ATQDAKKSHRQSCFAERFSHRSQTEYCSTSNGHTDRPGDSPCREKSWNVRARFFPPAATRKSSYSRLASPDQNYRSFVQAAAREKGGLCRVRLRSIGPRNPFN